MFTFAIMAVALAGSPAGTEAAAWGRLQRGMDRAKVAQLVGTPLLRNAARGHEVWIYDAGAHIQFHGGTVSAWTGPVTPERHASPRGTTSATAPGAVKSAAG